MTSTTDNRTTELRISEPLRGFIRHQSNRGYIDGGQASWLTKIADDIDAKHEQAVDDARIVEVTTSHIDIEQGEVITRFVPEQAIAATLGSVALTVEQVREAIMSADRWEKPMGDTGMTNTHLIIRDDGWQAIADELNAELGSEREKELKQLVRDMYEQWAYSIDGYYSGLLANYRKRMAELGVVYEC